LGLLISTSSLVDAGKPVYPPAQIVGMGMHLIGSSLVFAQIVGEGLVLIAPTRVIIGLGMCLTHHTLTQIIGF
jgi:hypothetical protein